jgi:4'-phosphopantetheinyl transferase
LIINALPALQPSDIHVWFADLDTVSELIGGQWKVLSEDERERASRFHFDIHRSRFIAARAALRTLLGMYLERTPRQLTFIYGANGKPTLSGHPMHFNVSHSEAGGLFAFTRLAPVGADLERVRPVPDMMQIARLFFSPLEARALLAVPTKERTDAFFRCWTRKEALIKATGDGLSCTLDSFAVSLGESASVLEVEGDPGAASEWSLYHLAPSAGYVGSVAIQQPSCRLLAMVLPRLV